MSQIEHTTVGEVRMVTLSRITPREGFNPRTGRDPDRFAQLVASVQADGILSPLLVTPGEGSELLLVAGEGRWQAAGQAGQTEVPVYVVEVDDRTGGLELAMVENMARQDFDPVQEAQGFQRLRDAGLTRKGIAERLGIPQRRVTDRLEILKVPEPLHAQIASGVVPPAAIKALVSVAKIHQGLPAVLAARVAAPPVSSWQPALSWAQVIQDPIGALTQDADGDGTQLPDDVYEGGESYPLARFTLSEQATRELDELLGLLQLDRERFTVRFGREAVERASALKATHAVKDGYGHLIVGQDVADELAADYVCACLTTQREAAKWREQPTPAGDGEEASSGENDSPEVVSEEEARAARAAEREAEQELRRRAVAHNAELGAALFKHLGRLKVDAGVLKVLTAVEVAGDLDGIAMRGARYGFPGWATEVEQKNGKLKVEYLAKAQAAAKAREFLDGVEGLAEIAGRLFCLIAMARYADERCVARSARSFSSLRVRDGVPYAGEVLDLIDEICEQRLPEHLTAEVREYRREQRQADAEHAAEVAAAQGRLDAALTGEQPLTGEELARVREDVELIHGRYSTDGFRLIRELEARAQPDTGAADGEPNEVVDEPPADDELVGEDQAVAEAA
jgi:ParB/RepB/Spo0J family partition protein